MGDKFSADACYRAVQISFTLDAQNLRAERQNFLTVHF